jgi:acyl carrier protein
MSNSEKLVAIFVEELEIEASIVTDDLKYASIPQWDSIAHMSLIAAIEEAFDIMLDTNDIVDMSSVGVAKTILGKHNVDF